MPFINGIWVDDSPSIVREVKKVDKNNVSITFFKTNIYNKKFKIVYSVDILNPYIDIYKNKIDEKSLKEALEAKIDSTDKNYIKLETFSTRFATYEFLCEKWLKDALDGVNPSVHLSKFEKAFTLKRKLPKMVMYSVSPYFDKFIIDRFKGLYSDLKFKSWFTSFFPQDFLKKVNSKVKEMFDYYYDYTYNKIIIKLKSQYIYMILFMIGNVTSKNKVANTKFEKEAKFRTNVFNKSKDVFEKFIGKKLF